MQDKRQKLLTAATFKIPRRRMRAADTNVAATPIKAHNPLNAPIMDELRPASESKSTYFTKL